MTGMTPTQGFSTLAYKVQSPGGLIKRSLGPTPTVAGSVGLGRTFIRISSKSPGAVAAPETTL